MDTAAALWWAVIAAGLYHGLNPGMGWPLAVSAALMERAPGHLWRALAALAAGHLLAMALVLLPFGALLFLAEWRAAIQVGAACMVIALGLYLLITRRHPRFLARVPPSRLVLWSFLAAMAHGAGLMLVPIYLGICEALGQGDVSDKLVADNASIAMTVAVVHTLAMAVASAGLAVAVYRWLGLQFLSKSWFNLDVVWALSLIAVGGASLYALT